MNAGKQLGAVSFSRDGQRVLFEGPTLIISRRGKFLRRIATDALNPVWSPNGRQIAFSTGDGLHTPILTMDARGNHHHRVLDFPSTIVRAIVWLPRR